jgi:hypothetical protein
VLLFRIGTKAFLGLAMFNGNTLRLEFAVARMNEPKFPNITTGERHITTRPFCPRREQSI